MCKMIGLMNNIFFNNYREDFSSDYYSFGGSDNQWVSVHNYFKNFDQDELLVNRVKLVYPLFGLKWCLILLNEFLPEYLQRRGFVAEGPVDKNILEIQMLKTQKMLSTIKNHFQHFTLLGSIFRI